MWPEWERQSVPRRVLAMTMDNDAPKVVVGLGLLVLLSSLVRQNLIFQAPISLRFRQNLIQALRVCSLSALGRFPRVSPLPWSVRQRPKK